MVVQVNARHAKARSERHRHSGGSLLLGGLAAALLALTIGRLPWLAFSAFVVALTGIWSAEGPLLSWPADFLRGPSAASSEPLGLPPGLSQPRARLGTCSATARCMPPPHPCCRLCPGQNRRLPGRLLGALRDRAAGRQGQQLREQPRPAGRLPTRRGGPVPGLPGPRCGGACKGCLPLIRLQPWSQCLLGCRAPTMP